MEAEVKTLLGLKDEYKKLTGKDWKPGGTQSACEPKPQAKNKPDAGEISRRLAELDCNLKQLRADSADKVSDILFCV